MSVLLCTCCDGSTDQSVFRFSLCYVTPGWYSHSCQAFYTGVPAKTWSSRSADKLVTRGKGFHIDLKKNPEQIQAFVSLQIKCHLFFTVLVQKLIFPSEKNPLKLICLFALLSRPLLDIYLHTQ